MQLEHLSLTAKGPGEFSQHSVGAHVMSDISEKGQSYISHLQVFAPLYKQPLVPGETAYPCASPPLGVAYTGQRQ